MGSDERSYVRIGGRKIHRAWIMLIGCSFLTAGTMGCIFGACGVFYVPVCNELGFLRSELASWQQAEFLALIPSMPIAAKILEKFNARIVMSVCVIVCAGAAAAMGTYTEVWQWVVSGILFGTFGACILQLPQVTILNNWFEKRTGVAMGVSTAFGSVGTAIFAFLFAIFIEQIGWRNTYFIQGFCVLLFSLPWTLFVFRMKPSDMGALPYGHNPSAHEEESNKPEAEGGGVPFRKGALSLCFIMMFLFAGAGQLIGAGYDAHMPGFANSIGYSALFGASLVSALQMGSFVEKLAMGWFNDRFGIQRTVYIEFIIVIVGLLGLAFVRNEWALVLFAFLFGVQDSFVSISLPLLLRKFFGNKYFSEYYAWTRVASGIFGSFGSRLVGLSFDLTASYVPAFLIGVCVCCVGALLVTIARISSKRLVWEGERIQDHQLKTEVFG